MGQRSDNRIAVAFVVLFTAGNHACAAASGSFDRLLRVSGPVDLEVSTGAGSISVQSGDSGAVSVRGTVSIRSPLAARAEERVREIESNPPIDQNGNTIRIGWSGNRALYRNVTISYEIIVPRQTRLRSTTGSGSQVIDGLAGPVEIATGSGSLRVTEVSGDLKAQTGSGALEIHSIEGFVDASTGSGSVRAERLSGGMNARTGSGGITARDAHGNVEVATGSGSVTLEGLRGSLRASTSSGGILASGEPTGDWVLDASSGNVTVRLPTQAGFLLDARAGSGSVTVSHPITVEGEVTRRQIRGTVRGGGPMLRLRTSSGSIRVE